MEVLKVSEIVRDILIKDSYSRDNDELLMINVWKKTSNTPHKLTVHSFEVRSNFARKVYNDPNQTLFQCGLTPSAALFVRNLS